MRTRVMCGVFLSTFSILGIIGNILSIIVFTRPSMRTDSNLILSGKTFIFTFQENNIQVSILCKQNHLFSNISLLFSSSWYLWFNLSFDPSFSTWIDRGCIPKRIQQCHQISFSCHPSNWFISLHLWNLYHGFIDCCTLYCHMSSR